MKIIKRLLKCVGEYKKDSIITPILIVFEVALECILPLVTSSMLNTIQKLSTAQPVEKSSGIIHEIETLINGWAGGDILHAILIHGAILVLLALLSLLCGALAGKTVANASAGFAKNLRRDVYYNIQTFSFV